MQWCHLLWKSKKVTKPAPYNYYFSGYFAFVLFGPFRACSKDRLAYLEVDDIGKEDDGNNIPSHQAACDIAQEQSSMTNKHFKKGKEI